MEPYNKETNYIGNADWQYKITKIFYKNASGINYSAYWHDFLYGNILHREHGITNRFILKVILDLLFLIMGFFRCLKNLQLHGCILTIKLWIVLFLHTPVYIFKMKK